MKHFIFNNLGLLCLLVNLFVVLRLSESLYFSFSLHFTVLTGLHYFSLSTARFLHSLQSGSAFRILKDAWMDFPCLSLSLLAPPRIWITSVLMWEGALAVPLPWLASWGPLPIMGLLKQSHLLRRAATSSGSKGSLLGEGWWALSPGVTRVSDSEVFSLRFSRKCPSSQLGWVEGTIWDGRLTETGASEIQIHGRLCDGIISI